MVQHPGTTQGWTAVTYNVRRQEKIEMDRDKKRRAAASVVLIAFAYGLNITGVVPVLGTLNEKYADYGTSAVQLLQTLPYLLTMAGSFMIGWLTTKITKKKIVLAGLFIIGVCGIIPFFTDSFYVLALTRLLIGFGFGITGPLNTAIITDFFPPEERAGYMGLHVLGMGIGAMVGNVLGGILAGYGYRMFYLVYAIAVLSMAAVAVILVETTPVAIEKAGAMKVNAKVYLISFASLLHTLFINAYNTNIGIYILEEVTENPTVTGMVSGINSAAALAVGMIFGRLSGLLGIYAMPFSVFAAAVGYAGLLVIPGMPGVIIASLCCGISLSCFMASSSYLISVSVRQEAVAKASGIFSIVGSIGGLIAPVVMANTASVVTGSDSPEGQFSVAFWGMLIFGAAAAALITLQSRKEKDL